MKVYEWLEAAVRLLGESGISTARLDCLVLLEDLTGKDRSWLLAHTEHELTTEQVEKLKNMLDERASHKPLAYIRGRTEFYGREFIISDAVLEPRPESEDMIDLLKELRPEGKIVDVGTGSGALGITAALEIPSSLVELLDIDESALDIARKNAAKYQLDIPIYKSDLLSKVKDAGVLLANLPYVPDDHRLNDAAMNEPKVAIFGGSDGLDHYRKLFRQAAGVRFILTESLPFQHEKLAEIAKAAGFSLKKTSDFIQQYAAD